MDHSIKKKPEKPRMCISTTGSWMLFDRDLLVASETAACTYEAWQRIRADLNKHEGK